MKPINLFTVKRKIYYHCFGHGRYKTHSQYVYDFYVNCLFPNKRKNLDMLELEFSKYFSAQAIRCKYVVIKNINSSRQELKKWKELINNHNGLSIETFSFGIIFNSDSFFKQNHILKIILH